MFCFRQPPAFTVGAMYNLTGAELTDNIMELRRPAQAILGLDQMPKSLEELRKAFRYKALACHPDKVPSNQREWAMREMQWVNEAYVLLTARLLGAQTSGQSRGRLLALST